MHSTVRTGRLFRRSSGRTFMVALDRTLMAGPVEHAREAEALLDRFARAPADALLLSPGLTRVAARHLAWAEAPRIVTRIDFPMVGDFAYDGVEAHRMICSPEEAAALGADAVIMCLISGFREASSYAANLQSVADTAAACRRIGLPLVVEAVLWGGRHADKREAGALAQICRIAAELGADIVKTQPPETVAGMQEIVETCPVPVTALGGASLSPGEMEALAHRALEGGAQGLVFGRNVWAREDADTVCAGLAELVHP